MITHLGGLPHHSCCRRVMKLWLKWLRHDVCYHLCSGTHLDFDVTFLDVVYNQLVSDVDVLRTIVVSTIRLCPCSGSCVVLEDDGFLHVCFVQLSHDLP